MLQLAAAVITGTGPIIACDPAAIRDDEVAAIGDVPTVQQQGRVLLVTWEDEPDEIARRWQLAGHALPNPENPGDALAVLNMRTLGGSLWAPHAGREPAHVHRGRVDRLRTPVTQDAARFHPGRDRSPGRRVCEQRDRSRAGAGVHVRARRRRRSVRMRGAAGRPSPEERRELLRFD